LADDVYKELKRLKRKDESFSELIRRLIKTRGMISDLAGSATLSSEEWMKLKELKEVQAVQDNERASSLISQNNEG
jgi:predicted CopG family antitoxin